MAFPGFAPASFLRTRGGPLSPVEALSLQASKLETFKIFGRFKLLQNFMKFNVTSP